MKDWLKDVAIRTVKTMAQAALGVIGASAMLSEVDWLVVASTVALAGISCVLMNIANYEVNK